MASNVFRFKKFSVDQAGAAHPVGTDGVLLGAWAPVEGARTVLDIGGGTGLIALMIAQRQPEAQIVCIDLHKESVQCAAKNFANSPWADRLQAVHLSFQAFEKSPPHSFDLIVSNPPFFSERSLSEYVTRNMVRNASFLPIDDLAKGAKTLLSENGKLCLILPEKEGKKMIEAGVIHGLHCCEQIKVYSKKSKPAERVLLTFTREVTGFQQSELTIHEPSGAYTPAFKTLTDSYYLDKPVNR